MVLADIRDLWEIRVFLVSLFKRKSAVRISVPTVVEFPSDIRRYKEQLKKKGNVFGETDYVGLGLRDGSGRILLIGV